MSKTTNLPGRDILRRLLHTLAGLFMGLAVTELGLIIWTLNLTFLRPTLAAALMLGVLWIYYKFFSGRHSINLSPRAWKWGLLAAALIVIVLESGLALVFRLVPFPEAAFKTQYKMLDTMPVPTAWIVVIVSSLVAGLCEETGFRGYMQTAMQKQLGPVPAIVLSSAAFVLLHLTKSWATYIIPLIFLTSFLLGWLAWRIGSILPGILAHATFDIFNFSYWWSHLAGNFGSPTIFRSGVDLHFIAVSLAFTGALAGFFWIMRKLKKADRARSAF